MPKSISCILVLLFVTSSFAGCFTTEEEQKESLDLLLRDLIKDYGILKISGHNEYSTKKCPGFDVPKEYSYLIKDPKAY